MMNRHGKHSSPRMQIVLPEPLNTRLREEAAQRKTTVAALVREAVEKLLKLTTKETE